MKTLLVIAALVTLVLIGVWNSPKEEVSAVFFEAELSTTEPTMFYLGSDAEGNPKMLDATGVLIPMAELSDLKTPEEIATRAVTLSGESIVQSVCAVGHPGGKQCVSDGKGGWLPESTVQRRHGEGGLWLLTRGTSDSKPGDVND